jgi:predicted nucleotidyltransferase
MHATVHDGLLRIAMLFIENLDLPDFEIRDIRLTGSLANFNWTTYSDFDVHVVTDYSTLGCDDVAEALYKAKKTIWNEHHDITVNGHEVEMYIEDTANRPHSIGVFSILKNQWIAKPKLVDPEYDKRAIDRKAQLMIDMIQRTLRRSKNASDYKQTLDKVYRIRQSGLEAGGEFSTENLAFKVLRNLGWIDRLRKGYDKIIDTTLSIR